MRHSDAPDEDLASTAWHHATTPDADGAPVRARFEPDEQLDPPRRNTREGEADDWLEAHPKDKKRLHEEAEYEMNKRENLTEGLDEATMQEKFSALLRAKGILAMDNEVGLDVMAVLTSLQPIAAAHGAVKDFYAEGSTVWMIGSKEKVGKVRRRLGNLDEEQLSDEKKEFILQLFENGDMDHLSKEEIEWFVDLINSKTPDKFLELLDGVADSVDLIGRIQFGYRKHFTEGYYHGPKPKYENPGHHDPTSPIFGEVTEEPKFC